MLKAVIRSAVLLAVTCGLSTASAETGARPRLSLDGYYKNFSVAYDFPAWDIGGHDSSRASVGAVSSRFRLNGRYRFAEGLALGVSYSLTPRIQGPSLFGDDAFLTSLDLSDYRVADLKERLYPESDDRSGSLALFNNLDRAFFVVTTRWFDVYAGRQPIAWGAARVVNPTDILAPYAYSEIDTEDRAGIDGARLRVPLGFMGEIDAGCVFGDDFEPAQSACFLRGKFYAAHTDISVLLIAFRENLLAGFDVSRAIGGAGFWVEGAHVFVDAFDKDGVAAEGGYFRGSIGLDYSLRGNIYSFIEYHFNQAGRDQPEDYIDNASTVAYTEGSVYLLGRHYLVPGLSCLITPLLTAAGEVVCNLSDGSVLIAPNLEYNIAEDIYLAAGAYAGIGARPRITPTLGNPREWLVLRSEFGGYPDCWYMSFRVYF